MAGKLQRIKGVLLAGLILSLMAASLAPRRGVAAQSTLTVIISEVAWSGTAASASDEWIELYNASSQTVDLTGWALRAEDGTPDITLSGSLPPGAYFLLERTDDNTISDLDADLIYTGSLSNTGETLRLYDASGAQVDSANAGGGDWPGGESTPRRISMERTGLCADTPDCWRSNDETAINGHDVDGNPIYGTPKARNSVWQETGTPSPTPTLTGTPSPTPTLLPSPTLTPSPAATLASGAVRINEIAWCGTAASASDEWMELYNASSQTVDLAGWVLRAEDGAPDITLSGSLPPGGYFLLERSDDDTISDIAADLIYTGSLSNDGERLILLNADGQEMDRVDAASGWPAGSTALGCASMERSAAGWLTFDGAQVWAHDAAGNAIHGTPRRVNWALSVTPTPTQAATATASPSPTATPRPVTPTPLALLNEINPRPGRDWNGDGQLDWRDEYIEVINPGQETLSLKNWRLDLPALRQSFRLPDFSLAAGQSAVFFASFTALHLPDNGTTIRLLNSRGRILDAFTYGVPHRADAVWCRQPAGYGGWVYPCQPSPLNSRFPLPMIDRDASRCALPEQGAEAFRLGECAAAGAPRRARLPFIRWLFSADLPGGVFCE